MALTAANFYHISLFYFQPKLRTECVSVVVRAGSAGLELELELYP